MDESKYAIQKTIFDLCPVCKNGKVYDWKPTGILGFAKSNLIACQHCNAKFTPSGQREGEPLYQLDLIESDKQHNYDKQSLKKSEWVRGISDLDLVLQSNELPKYTIEGLQVVLQEDEKTHYYVRAKMLEERAVRQHVGGSLRIMKGVWIRTGQAESHGELREIDNGALLLTNKRVVFDGNMRKIEYKLPKIITINIFDDAVQLGVSNRKKSQLYVVNEPLKCGKYIELATKLYAKDMEKTTTGKGVKGKENKVLEVLNLRYARGEITKEEYEQMKKDILGI